MTRTIRAPRGTQLHCKGWLQEAAYRMIQNNLDPDVAYDPEHLIVYGGRGRAARNWEAFDAILRTRLQRVAYSRRWRHGLPIDRDGTSHAFKYIRLESFDDAIQREKAGP